MSWPPASDPSPYAPPPPSEGWPGPGPQVPPTPQGPPPVSRTSMVVALFLVAVLAGSALFAAGFTLGLQQSLTPGTGESEQELFAPFWEAYRKVTVADVRRVARRYLRPEARTIVRVKPNGAPETEAEVEETTEAA